MKEPAGSETNPAAPEPTMPDSVTLNWQPIETAPRDGTRILVWPPTWTGTLSVAAWDEDQYVKRPIPYWRRIDAGNLVSVSRGRPPTHWAPIPSGPSE